MFLAGAGLNDVDARGRPITDDSFVLLFNAGAEAVHFTLPATLALGPGELLVDTRGTTVAAGTRFDPAVPYELGARSLALACFAQAVPA